jgi:Secretion system C-terminal sorting domain
VEQITLDDPAAGTYRLRISGFNVTGSQEFFLAYQIDSTEIFAWEFPTAVDFITSAASNVIRWNASKSSNVGKLEYSTDKGSSWQPIKNDVDLSTGFYPWQAPAVIDQALLRMSIGASVYTSDTFTISSRTLTGVGFNCPDSLLFYWQKLPGVQDYRVYTLGSLYLDTITVTADSLIVLDKKAFPALDYAVAPLIDGKEGIRSYTIDYTLQGVECYIRSFLGSLENNTGILELTLGTMYGIESIVLEKLTGDRYVEFAKINQPDSLINVFTDTKLSKGLNVYRSKIVLTGGRVIYTLPETIYNLEQSRFIIFPNPVRQNQPVEVLISNDILTEVTLLIYDSFGRMMMQKKLNNFREQINIDQLASGMYIFRFMVEGEKDTIMKVVIL